MERRSEDLDSCQAFWSLTCFLFSSEGDGGDADKKKKKKKKKKGGNSLRYHCC